jgi:hypothetical protein
LVKFLQHELKHFNVAKIKENTQIRTQGFSRTKTARYEQQNVVNRKCS